MALGRNKCREIDKGDCFKRQLNRCETGLYGQISLFCKILKITLRYTKENINGAMNDTNSFSTSIPLRLIATIF